MDQRRREPVIGVGVIDQARVELVVHGVVQGVYFRKATQTRARELGLVGRVRNEPDGSVSVVAQGPREAVEALVQWCHRGPSGARVDRVDATRPDASGGFDEFTIER